MSAYDYERVIWREDHDPDISLADGAVTHAEFTKYVFALHDDITGIQLLSSHPGPCEVMVRITTGQGPAVDAAIAVALEESFADDPLLQLIVIYRCEPMSEQGREVHARYKAAGSK